MTTWRNCRVTAAVQWPPIAGWMGRCSRSSAALILIDLPTFGYSHPYSVLRLTTTAPISLPYFSFYQNNYIIIIIQICKFTNYLIILFPVFPDPGNFWNFLFEIFLVEKSNSAWYFFSYENGISRHFRKYYLIYNWANNFKCLYSIELTGAFHFGRFWKWNFYREICFILWLYFLKILGI